MTISIGARVGFFDHKVQGVRFGHVTKSHGEKAYTIRADGASHIARSADVRTVDEQKTVKWYFVADDAHGDACLWSDADDYAHTFGPRVVLVKCDTDPAVWSAACRTLVSIR